MKIKLDIGAKMPTYAHDNDAGMDLYAKQNELYIIQPKSSVIVDTGVHIEIPRGCFGDVRAKSGMLFKCDILTTGTVDCGYTGSIKVKLINLGDKEYVVGDGDKIAQLVITPYLKADFEITNKLDETDRGSHGFGSTGRK